jgi:hypothetical protein
MLESTVELVGADSREQAWRRKHHVVRRLDLIQNLPAILPFVFPMTNGC